MNEKQKQIEQTTDNSAFTADDIKQFLTATGEEQWVVLLAHAEKNKEAIAKRKSKTQQDGCKRNN